MQTGSRIKRFKAFLIDYAIIVGYIFLLFGSTMGVLFILGKDPGSMRPLFGDFTGFVTLTLPVILYFSVMETGTRAGTLGKRRLGLRVLTTEGTKATFGRVLVRNVLKFLPWELAHFFVYRLISFSSEGAEVPTSVLAGLIVAQLLAVGYVLCIFLNKKRQAGYELLSGTRVVEVLST